MRKRKIRSVWTGSLHQKLKASLTLNSLLHYFENNFYLSEKRVTKKFDKLMVFASKGAKFFLQLGQVYNFGKTIN